MERKQSSITFDFSSFKDTFNDDSSIICAAKGSKVIIDSFLNTELKSRNKTTALDVWDLVINVKNGEMKVINTSVGDVGREGDADANNYLADGGDGSKGAFGIKGNNVKLDGNLTVQAGKGGRGGNGHTHWNKADGGNGGAGGSAIGYRSTCLVSKETNLIGGEGGAGGNGDSSFHTGKDGTKGSPGQKTEKIN